MYHMEFCKSYGGVKVLYKTIPLEQLSVCISGSNYWYSTVWVLGLITKNILWTAMVSERTGKLHIIKVVM